MNLERNILTRCHTFDTLVSHFPITKMSTKKPRFNITLKKDTALYLKQLALRDEVPPATKISELVELAMEIEEDFRLSAIADKRLEKMTKTISHQEFWSKVRS